MLKFGGYVFLLKKPFTDINGSVIRHFPTLYGTIDDDTQKARYKTSFDKFKQIFHSKESYIASSSGRVEIIGNHTDHNGGRVISCAISLDTLAFFLPTSDTTITIVSEGYNKIIVDTEKKNLYKKGTSHAIVCGIIEWFKSHNYKVGGFNAYCTSTICSGAGISSSASFEVLIAEILNFLFNDDKLSPEQKAIASQYAENEFFGKPCGLLDQSTIAYGGVRKFDFYDTKKIYVHDIPNNLSKYTLILINTGGSHANLTNEYESIPKEMFLVAKSFGKDRLIDITKRDFIANIAKHQNELPDRAILRALHFYQENDRVDLAEISLKNNDYKIFLEQINRSGYSSMCLLQNCFVAGQKDQPISKALAVTGTFIDNGAHRVHGGGFAGCILNIIKKENVKTFVDNATMFFGNENVLSLQVRQIGTIVL